MNELKKQYSELNDYELINIVYFESSEYTEEAIKVAKSTLEERGLRQPTDEILQKAKEYCNTPADDFDGLGKKLNPYEWRKIKKAVKKRDYLFVGKWLFWSVLVGGIFHAIKGWDSFRREWLPPWMLFLLEIFFTIAIIGIIPVIFFFIYSFKLTKEQRKEKGLILFMPKYVFFIYGFSLFIFIVFVL